MKNNFKFKKDKFKSSRGGYSRLLSLYCFECNNLIIEYQKDGPGNLRRLYLDRIMAPEKLVGLQYKNIKDVSMLKCNKCGFVIGVPYIYKKEKRKAFRVFQDAILKKIVKIN